MNWGKKRSVTGWNEAQVTADQEFPPALYQPTQNNFGLLVFFFIFVSGGYAWRVQRELNLFTGNNKGFAQYAQVGVKTWKEADLLKYFPEDW